MTTQDVKEKEKIYLVISTDAYEEEYQTQYVYRSQSKAIKLAEELTQRDKSKVGPPIYIVQEMDIEDT